jgi:DUF4097 and DUF4098 domain-containing protein YvlB
MRCESPLTFWLAIRLWSMTRAAAVLLILSLCPNCGISQSFVEQHTEKYPAGAHTKIVLQNGAGNVTILPWDEPIAQIDWVLRAYHKRALDGAWVEINPEGDRIDVRTAYPIANDVAARMRQRTSGPDSVDYVLHVPRSIGSVDILSEDGELKISEVKADVRVSSRNGTVAIENVSGNMEITTMHAPQVIRLGRVSGHRTIRLDSVNGSIHVSLSPTSSVNLQATSASGGLSNQFGWIAQKKNYESGRKLQGKLGTGEATVEIEEVNGSITAVAE